MNVVFLHSVVLQEAEQEERLNSAREQKDKSSDDSLSIQLTHTLELRADHTIITSYQTFKKEPSEKMLHYSTLPVKEKYKRSQNTLFYV